MPTVVSSRPAKRSFQGVIWQRCQVHFRRNVIDRAPKRHHDVLDRGLDRILEAHDPEEAREEFRRLYDELEGKADRALQTLDEGLEDSIQVLVLPRKYRSGSRAPTWSSA